MNLCFARWECVLYMYTDVFLHMWGIVFTYMRQCLNCLECVCTCILTCLYRCMGMFYMYEAMFACWECVLYMYTDVFVHMWGIVFTYMRRRFNCLECVCACVGTCVYKSMSMFYMYEVMFCMLRVCFVYVNDVFAHMWGIVFYLYEAMFYLSRVCLYIYWDKSVYILHVWSYVFYAESVFFICKRTYLYTCEGLFLLIGSNVLNA